MAKKVRKLVFVHGDWQLCLLERNKYNDRDMWVYVGSMAFCCYVDEGKITHDLPPKPKAN